MTGTINLTEFIKPSNIYDIYKCKWNIGDKIYIQKGNSPNH